MSSSPYSIKLTPDIAEISKLRAKQLGYPSWGAYIKGLIRYDAMVLGDHAITQPFAHIPLVEQDRVDAKLLANTKNGTAQRGEYLKRLLDGAEE